ncbi:fumarylacetoacetate hydrolase family protein [Amycolatopsis sp. lyj-90]|uniref:fumarylacetoacetate hydrolase family protein n=1 Tax=Amycolatopsis sp. lyj-90 TaxID=2789285 RepID=UPI0039798CC5
MKFATVRLPGGATAAARIENGSAFLLDALDVGRMLQDESWRRARATGEVLDATALDYAPVIPAPGKIICVGLNYRSHIREMGREFPDYPTLFAKYPEALVGPYDPVRLPPDAPKVDWEAELALVMGKKVRWVDVDEAEEAIAGYTVINDVTMREHQYRTPQWLQGKTFEGTAPLGPVLVTPDELDPSAELTCALNGEVVQRARIDDLVFSPARLVSYISGILTLRPGDIIATGTPGGVGHASSPARYLTAGDVLTTGVAGIGSMENRVS